MDAVAEVLPIPYLRFGGAVDRIQDRRANSLASTGLRAWGGLRLKEVWFDLGVLRRDSVVLPAPVLVGATDDSASGPATGLTASIEGRVWRSLFANLWAVRWMDSSRLLRPEYQSRSELFIRTNLPERFPRGNFSFLLSVRHEYRSKVLFPMESAVLPASGEHAITSLH
jgi:hypothetical protein